MSTPDIDSTQNTNSNNNHNIDAHNSMEDGNGHVAASVNNDPSSSAAASPSSSSSPWYELPLEYIRALWSGILLTYDGIMEARHNSILRVIYKRYIYSMIIAGIILSISWAALLVPIYITVFIMELIMHSAIWVWLSPSLHAWFFEFMLFTPIIGMLIMR
jgi:hypothetical protein